MSVQSSPPTGRVEALLETLGLVSWAARRAVKVMTSARIDSPRRAVVVVGATIALSLLTLVHWAFLLLDEVVVPGYRRRQVVEPLFVVGMPRSGTSFLQATLAADQERFSTVRLRELLFTPAVSQRWVWEQVARVDARLGRPLERTGRWIERRTTRDLDDVHPIDLDEPEEDFLYLLPAWACFALVAVFPESESTWALTRVDSWPARDRDKLMTWYRLALQRQLYWDARTRPARPSRAVLSKNPSFTGWVISLRNTFPDARFVCCYREPVARALASQLSSMAPAMSWGARDPAQAHVREGFETMYEDYARSMVGLLDAAATSAVALPLSTLSADTEATIRALYAHFGWTPSDDFADWLRAERSRSRRHRSAHRYSAEEFGLDEEAVRERFAPWLESLARHALAVEAT